VDTVRIAIFDKTGTLTYGRPVVTEILVAPGSERDAVLTLVASLERYSKHPLAAAVTQAAEESGLSLLEASEISELPGQGMRGTIDGRAVRITSRKAALSEHLPGTEHLPPSVEGMEAVILIDGRYAAAFRFRDEPRDEGVPFIHHLGPRHRFERVMLVSGDRESEVRYLADHVGIDEVYASQTPEQKLELVRRETERAPTLFVGDGINDAPALTAATVGVAFGGGGEIPAEAAGAVVLESSLQKVDELLHIGRRLRRIALQSAVGGMALSVLGMLVAAAGYLPPVAGAITQEVIDVVVVVNALRVGIRPKSLTDYQAS
jgi:P-type E1-E2 ATPase